MAEGSRSVTNTIAVNPSVVAAPPPPRGMEGNFAAKVGELGESDFVQPKRPKKRSIKGTGESVGLKGVAPKIWWQFAINRLDTSTTSDEVKRHLQSKGIEVVDVWLLQSQIEGTKTAKVRVAREHGERAKDPALWPVHCRIRDWDFSAAKPRDNKRPNNVGSVGAGVESNSA